VGNGWVMRNDGGQVKAGDELGAGKVKDDWSQSLTSRSFSKGQNNNRNRIPVVQKG